MVDDLISDGIIAIGDNLSVPLDCYKTFPDEFFFKDRSVSRVNHTATAFLLPVAQSAYVTCPIDGFENVRLVDSLL